MGRHKQEMWGRADKNKKAVKPYLRALPPITVTSKECDPYGSLFCIKKATLIFKENGVFVLVNVQ